MMILGILMAVTLIAMAAVYNCIKVRDELVDAEAQIDELREAIDNDSIVIVNASAETKMYKRKYENQLQINAKLMERIKKNASKCEVR